MTKLYAQPNAGRRKAWIAAVVLVAAAAAVFAWTQWAGGASSDLMAAGSGERFAPIQPIRLVSVMDPPDQVHMHDFGGGDPAAVSDSDIQVGIAVALERMNLPVEPLDIRVDDRKVLLEGRVDDALTRDAIEVTVRSVDGVREVANEIEVIGE